MARLSESAGLAKNNGMLSIFAQSKILLGIIERKKGNGQVALSHWTDVIKECSNTQSVWPVLDDICPEVEQLTRELSQDPGESATWFRAIIELSSSYVGRGLPGEAGRLAQWALTQPLSHEQRAEANATGGLAELMQGRAHPAKRMLQEALAAMESAQGPQGAPAGILQHLGKAQKLLGEYPEAVATLHRVETALRKSVQFGLESSISSRQPG